MSFLGSFSFVAPLPGYITTEVSLNNNTLKHNKSEKTIVFPKMWRRMELTSKSVPTSSLSTTSATATTAATSTNNGTSVKFAPSVQQGHTSGQLTSQFVPVMTSNPPARNTNGHSSGGFNNGHNGNGTHHVPVPRPQIQRLVDSRCDPDELAGRTIFQITICYPPKALSHTSVK